MEKLGRFGTTGKVVEKARAQKSKKKRQNDFKGKEKYSNFKSTVSGTPIAIETVNVQVKGIVYNTALQGQIKFKSKIRRTRTHRTSASRM